FNNGREKIRSQNGVTTVAEYKEETAPNYAQQTVLSVDGKTFLENTVLRHEVFGPFSIIVQCENLEELTAIINKLDGQLTGTIIAESAEISNYDTVISALQNRVGRLIFNGVPTGVEVCASMLHGGPYPASSDSRFTAVGIHAVKRWVRPFSYQNWPDELLPEALQNKNPLNINRTVNDVITNKPI
ncbi:MAG: aldehyde dehydrogenase family protein, partial [Flavobacterium sp.]